MNVTSFCNKISPKALPSLNINKAIKTVYPLNDTLSPVENITPQLLGTVVDVMIKFMLGKKEIIKSVEGANIFRISLMGAMRVGEMDIAENLISSINGLDDESIISACKLTTYDVAFRAGRVHFKGHGDINPDRATVNNIRIMVSRTVDYLTSVDVVSSGKTFRMGYTDIVTRGDCDFICKTGIIELKVFTSPIGFKHLLQTLIYHLLAVQSDLFYSNRNAHSFKSNRFKHLRIFNPRTNMEYMFPIKSISKEDIDHITCKGGFY